MIKSKFTFFQMQAKRTFANASELIEPGFCDAPKVLNAVDMVMAVSKFITSMLDPIVLFITEVYKAVIGLKSIGINRRVLIDLLLYNGHQRASGAVFNNLGVNLTTAFDQAKDNVFTPCPTTPDPSYSPGSKVAFVNLNFTGIKGTLLLTVVSHSFSDFIKNSVDRLSGRTRQFSNFCRFNIQGKQLNNLPNFCLRNS